MNVTTLISEYNKAKKIKKAFDFSKLLKRNYVPHLEKINALESVVNRCSYDEINGEKVYNRHTPTLYFTFTMRMIQLYTNIDIEKPVEDYDALSAAGLLHTVISLIPTEEYTECETIMTMIRDDIEFNTKSLVSFLENKTKAINIGLDTVLSTMSNPDMISKIAKQLQK